MTHPARASSFARRSRERNRARAGVWAGDAHLHAMSDRERADAVLEHVAVLAFLYYPGIEVDDPSYSLTDDIEWCLARLGDVSDVERDPWKRMHRHVRRHPRPRTRSRG